MNEVSKEKLEKIEAYIKELKKAPDKKKKVCRRGDQCCFYHDFNHKADKKSEDFKNTQTKKLKDKTNLEMETMQEHGPNLMQILKYLLMLIIRENSLKYDSDTT